MGNGVTRNFQNHTFNKDVNFSTRKIVFVVRCFTPFCPSCLPPTLCQVLDQPLLVCDICQILNLKILMGVVFRLKVCSLMKIVFGPS